MAQASSPPPGDARQREAQAALERLHDQPTYAGSALADAGRRAAAHFAGRDPGDAAMPLPDATELWGRRIGRALSLAGCIALAAYLYVTYLR
ncbi:MAG: hypothetical protein IT538_07180 [Variibacter sp.]|nr:hypothetical protein [Variibacter sp.]